MTKPNTLWSQVAFGKWTDEESLWDSHTSKVGT